MTQERWSAVDAYISESLVAPDQALDATLADSEAAGLPSIQVAANQGKLLHLLARLQGARTILEIGTLGGYSTIWLARAVPLDGRLVTLELESRHAKVARANIARAGLAERVEVRVGPASESLARLAEQGVEPFDFVFIDADKEGYPAYLGWALKLTRPGSLIVADNVVRGGALIDPASSDPRVHAVRRFIELVAAEPRLDATVVQTVGSKGYDGLAFALVVGEG
ncbi:MAG: O-methyltransferase [Chloroflexota bacterium]|nr:O-methyltransferase [Chloroflexota bacterium]